MNVVNHFTGYSASEKQMPTFRVFRLQNVISSIYLQFCIQILSLLPRVPPQ